MSAQEFAGKVAVVTGAASGIGRAILTALVTAGAKGVIADVDAEWGAMREAELKAQGHDVIFVKTNVADSSSVKALYQTVEERYGAVDIVVNSAGVGVHAEVVDMTDEQWDFQVDVQLRGTFLMCREAGRLMIKHGRKGRIINIGSTAAAIARFRSSAHSASKSGVIMLSKVMALEVGRYGITVNMVCPGLTDVGPTSRSGGSTLEYQKQFLMEVPHGRLATPEEIADAVSFFASDRARFVTGQVLYVDGGYSSGKTGVRGPHNEYFLQPESSR